MMTRDVAHLHSAVSVIHIQGHGRDVNSESAEGLEHTLASAWLRRFIMKTLEYTLLL